MPNTTSKFLTLDKTDLQKLGKSLLLSIVAAAGVAVAAWFDALPSAEEWGALAPIIAAFAPFVANVIRKLLSNAKVIS
jgi:hypothetical protein